jgi:hypothetical protein
VEYRHIGSLTVPVVGLGCNQFGTAARDETTSIAVVHDAFEAESPTSTPLTSTGRTKPTTPIREAGELPRKYSAGRCEGVATRS